MTCWLTCSDTFPRTTTCRSGSAGTRTTWPSGTIGKFVLHLQVVSHSQQFIDALSTRQRTSGSSLSFLGCRLIFHSSETTMKDFGREIVSSASVRSLTSTRTRSRGERLWGCRKRRGCLPRSSFVCVSVWVARSTIVDLCTCGLDFSVGCIIVDASLNMNIPRCQLGTQFSLHVSEASRVKRTRSF